MADLLGRVRPVARMTVTASADGGGTPERMVVAAFDFDRTITTRDTVVPFVRSLAGDRRLITCAVRHGFDLAADVVRRRRDALKARAAACAFTGRSVADIDRRAESYAVDIVSRWLRPDVVERLRWHQSLGHLTVLVSASFEIYLRPMTGLLGVDGVLGTRLGHVDGTYTGMIDGPNCRGREKVRRLEEWFETKGLERRSMELWAYGDSAGDVDLLAVADHSIWATGVIGKVPVVAPSHRPRGM